MELLEPRTRARRYSWVTERSARSGQPQAPPDPKYRDLVLTETRMHAERVTKARRRRATRRIRLGRPSSIRSRPTDPPGRASWRRDQAAASRSGGGRCDASEAARQRHHDAAHPRGIHARTVSRWKARRDVADRSTRPHRLATTISPWEEGLIVELRRSLALPLDDIVEAMRRGLNPKLSRSGIHRCLQRHGLSARLTPQTAPAVTFQTDTPAGFIHIDVKYLPPLGRRRSYAYVAIDRATRFVYLEILPDRRAATAAGFLERFLARFPLEVHTILTDNGSESTDRFAVDKKAKPHDKPSGTHAFDRLCTARAITHRLTRPFRPQTNGMVERFNRRLGEHLDRVPQNRTAHHRRFLDHAERDAYLHTFVADYNRTRLRCLDYQDPAELLAKLAGHNTKAGEGAVVGYKPRKPGRPSAFAGAGLHCYHTYTLSDLRLVLRVEVHPGDQHNPK